MTDTKDLEYLVDLFDDPDLQVASALDKKIRQGGPELLDALRNMAIETEDEARRDIINRKFIYYSAASVLDQLEKYAALAKKEEATLLEGAYLVSALLTPGYKRAAFYDDLIPLIGEIMSETSEDKTAVENARILNHIFYNRYRFTTTDPFSFSEDNSLFINVIEKRRGNPVAISVLYFAIAHAAGLPVYPLCFKGGFVPVYEENGKILFYLNVFHKGEIFMQDSLSAMMATQGIDMDTSSMVVKKDATILTMYMELIAFYYDQKGNKAMVELLAKAMSFFGNQRYMVIDEEDE
ncbi:MAG: hypothetical protein IKH93_05105 [Bacteroidales bacterium]|nr:hypothetical protein [Bacteroidales bacterium]